ncbi:CHAT domain-containing protein [Fulvivirga ligni]|uniref:CHAT domain-containing protein n=1 Tax=Fulvivirga ligni TaxID=2904246 RepID=UPI001F1B3250|nr:CHAT domain-containing tetratricopeptide repeat protein [Fulvivirga ligni]UII23945.1 CHAT domain-containing protein [Fulvivirga ligni]
MWLDSKKKILLLASLCFAFTSWAQSSCEKISLLVKEGKIMEAETLISSSTNACPLATAEFYLRKGRNDLAQELYEKAYKQSSKNSEDQAASLNGLGLTYWAQGDQFMASEYISQALKMREGLNNKEQIAASFNDLGLVSDTPDQSLDYYEKALKMYTDLSGHEEKIAQLKTNIGIIYREMSFYGDAQNYLNEALSTWEKLYPDGHPNKAFVLLNLGKTFESMQNNDEALLYYGKSLAEYKNNYGAKHPDIGYNYNLIGNVYYKQVSFDEALFNYQNAIVANTIKFNNTDITVNPSVKDYLNAQTLLSSLYFKSQAFEDYHYAYSRKPRDLKLSLSTLQSCDSLIDNIRHIQTNEQDQIQLSDIAVQVYESGVRLCYQMAEVSIKKEPLYELSFYFSEKNKSAVLLQSISDVSAKSFANIPSALLEEENDLKSNIAFYEQKIAAGEEQYSSALFDLKQKYQQFISRLEKDYPEYYNLKYNVPVPSIVKLQNELKSNTALVSYFIENRFNKLYTFYVTKDKFEVSSTTLSEDFDRYLTGFRNGIYYKDDETYGMTAYELYKTLFPIKIDKGIENLLIIPAGRLGTIPFEALSTSKIKSIPIQYNELDYLVNEYNISYQPSSILYSNKNYSIGGKSALLCAPVTFTNQPSLPGTEKEITDIKSILSSQNWTPSILLQGDAKEQKLKEQDLNKYDIIHLATHGVVDEQKPELSRILLHSDGENDGSLYTGEIYNMQMKAELVTLSACETGLGKISQGEGIIGLSRALTYAGADNIVVSLWSVADNSTSQLMSNFYQELSEQDYVHGLRKAKKSLISNGEYAHPYYWAPFVLIGQ